MASGSVSNWEWFDAHRNASGKVATRASQVNWGVRSRNGGFATRSAASLRGNYKRKPSAKY